MTRRNVVRESAEVRNTLLLRRDSRGGCPYASFDGYSCWRTSSITAFPPLSTVMTLCTET
jgi:hypothetical protein